MKASIRLDVDHNVGEIDRRIFGGFLEHLGRAVYGGVYEREGSAPMCQTPCGNSACQMSGIRAATS